jgi:hypothetical protein
VRAIIGAWQPAHWPSAMPSTNTKPLPADAGRFAGVLFDMLEYEIIGEIAAGCTEKTAGMSEMQQNMSLTSPYAQ